MSTAQTYIRDSLTNTNLTIRTVAHVNRIIFDESKRAVGVSYIDSRGAVRPF